MRCTIFLVACMLAVHTAQTPAAVTVYTSKPEWLAAAGSSTFIGFTGFATNTVITNQYASQGVLFTDGNDHIRNSPGYLDGSALLSTEFISPYGGRVRSSFPEPRFDIAVDFRGALLVELYSNGQLIFTSGHFDYTFTPFVGLHSSTPFDTAVLYDGYDEVVVIDNLYFGPAVPTPGALGLLAIAEMISRRQRKEQP